MSEDAATSGSAQNGATRRRFLQQTGRVAAVGGVAGVLLTGCGDDAATGGGGESTVSSSGTTADGGTPRRGGDLEVSMTDYTQPKVNFMDPSAPAHSADIIYRGLVYDSLVRTDLDFKPEPALAESWDSDDAGKVWEFKLRRGVQFHSGKELSADDVVESLQRMVDPDGVGTGVAIFAAYLTPRGVKKVDAHTVRITLERPNFFLPQFLAGMYSKIGQAGTKDWESPAGTGPFRLAEYRPNSSVLVERNDAYWIPERPYLDSVRLVNVGDQAAKLQTVLAGTAHLGDTITPKLIPQVQNSGVADGLTAPGGAMVEIVWQGQHAPFDNPDVRRALKMATDRKEIVEAVYYGQAQVAADIPIPPNDPLFPSGMEPLPFDPEQAQSLLKSAGHEGLKFTINTSPWYPGPDEVAVVLQQQYEKAGMKVAIQGHTPDVFLSSVALQRPCFMDAWLRQHALMLAPLLYTPRAPLNETQTDEPRIISSLAAAAASAELEEQRKHVADASALMAESSSVVTAYTDVFWPKKRDLKGLRIDWGSMVLMTDAYLEA